MRKFALDISPLRKYRELRLLFASGMITRLGSAMTMVALPFQIKVLTNSYVAVGLMGIVQLVPLIIFGLYGGVLADSVDRKKMILLAEASSLVMTLVLFLNALLPNPHIVILYIVGAAFAALSGLSAPSLGAILPRIVSHEDMAASNALMGLRWQFGAILGPSIGGLIVSTAGVATGYALDVISYVLSLIFIILLRPVPAGEKSTPPNLRSLLDGLQYAISRKDLLGTYLVDLSAMFFAMPTALFPFWADSLHARWALGLFYSAGTVGAMITTLTSGWMKNYPHHGRAVMWAAIGWGASISLAGTFNSLFMVLFFLTLAGASDEISALFRSLMWNQSIADEYRGRLGGIELLSYSVGPLGGQMRAGSMAAWTNLRTSVVSGGLLCIGFVVLAASALPKFRNYDVRTNQHVLSKEISAKNSQDSNEK
ncbi:MAG: MFS transporter [Actinomycetes bacterium]